MFHFLSIRRLFHVLCVKISACWWSDCSLMYAEVRLSISNTSRTPCAGTTPKSALIPKPNVPPNVPVLLQSWDSSSLSVQLSVSLSSFFSILHCFQQHHQEETSKQNQWAGQSFVLVNSSSQTFTRLSSFTISHLSSYVCFIVYNFICAGQTDDWHCVSLYSKWKRAVYIKYSQRYKMYKKYMKAKKVKITITTAAKIQNILKVWYLEKKSKHKVSGKKNTVFSAL